MCNTIIYSIHVLHMYTYMCNTGIYPTQVLHVQYMCIKHVSAIHNTPGLVFLHM